jgi:hypothetical protein
MFDKLLKETEMLGKADSKIDEAPFPQLKIKKELEGKYNIPLAAEAGYEAVWLGGSYQEIRVSGPDKSIMLTIPTHGSFIQLGSTVKNVDEIGIILKVAKQAMAQAFEGGEAPAVESKITEGRYMSQLAKKLGVRADWHEPDEQGVTVKITGKQFDNAMGNTDSGEINVHFYQEGKEVGAVNLATLCAMAAGTISESKANERNMSYVRFENTYTDLSDCLEHLNDDNLSESELRYRNWLVEKCQEIVDSAEEVSSPEAEQEEEEEPTEEPPAPGSEVA